MTTSRSSRCPTCHRRIKRSSEANRRYWALLHAVSEKLRPGGKQYSAESYHLWAKSKWIGCDEMKLPNGAVLLMPRSSADLSTEKFADYMTQLEAWANDLDVFLEDAESAA